MTSEQFLATFQQHLQLSDPQRQDVIAETKQHLSELEPSLDPVVALGKPEVLARHLNRVHVGWGWQWWMPLLLFAIWLGVQSVLSAWAARLGVSAETLASSRLHTAVWFSMSFVWTVGALGGIVFVGRQMSRRRSPWRYMGTLIIAVTVVTFVTATKSMLNEPGLDADWVLWLAGFEIAVVAGLAVCFGTLLAMITFLPRQQVSERRRRFGLVFEILLFFGLLVIGCFGILMLSETLFQPYDTWPTELRPAGSWVLTVNNFFESGFGTPLLLLGYIFLIGRHAWKNIRRLTAAV